MAEEKTVKETAPKFTRAQLEGSKKYADKVDLIRVLLDETKEYTQAEADAIIAKEFKRPEVKEIN